MMLTFLIDQSEQLFFGLFQATLEKLGSKKSHLWREIRQFFDGYFIPSWKVLCKSNKSSFNLFFYGSSYQR
ncbi:MAG: hypothetical protein AAGG81_07915, partial [Chlamydiota bacterium]